LISALDNNVHIRMVNISKSFGENKVLENFFINVEKGEFLTILGPSGCGKTTTLNLLAGFLFPDSGEIWIGDREVSRIPSHKRNLAMVFQNFALFPHMNVYENVSFGLKIRKVSNDIIYKKVENMLNLVGLDFETYKDRYSHQLSGGEQQRVSLARALVIEPEVLLLDEPLSNLDAKLRNNMRVEIKKIQEDIGTTTIYVTHDQEEALALSNKIALLHEGKISQIGSPPQIYSNPKSKFVADFIGHSNFIQGTVSEIADDEVIIQIYEGLKIHTDLRDFMKKNREVTLIIRDENIMISENKIIGENVFKGEVESSLYLGPFQRTYVRIGDLYLSIFHKLDKFGRLPRRGDSIFVQLERHQLMALPGEIGH